MRVRVLLSENLCNRSPGFRALVVREKTPYPLPVGCTADSLPEHTIQNCVVVASCHGLILLFCSTGGPALPGSPFCLGNPHQACVETPLPEVHPPGDLRLDLLCPADAQRLRKNDVDKDKGYIRVPTPVENPPPFRCKYYREAAPHCYLGHGVPASRLCG